ncbi:MAG: CpXC domain-containing protein [Candidatus Aminicenantes bacterium]
MSRKVTINISCPHCGFMKATAVYTSVNVTLNPELRRELFDDRLNRFKCPDCGKIFLVEINLMYHDMERKFAVWYCPQGDVPEIEKETFGKLSQKMGMGEYLSQAPSTYDWEDFKKAILKIEEST